MDKLLVACAILLLFVAAQQEVHPHRSPLRVSYGVPLDPQPPNGGIGGGGGGVQPPPDQPPGQTGYPTVTSTGPAVPPATPFAGTAFGATAYRIDTPGVYDGFIFDRCVTIFANDVTIRNSVINCRQGNYPAIWFRDGAANGRVETSAVNGIKIANTSPSSGVDCANNCAATGNRIIGPQVGIRLSNGSTAQGNYIGQLRGSQTNAGPSEHNGIFVTTGDATITHNTIDNNCDQLLNSDDAQGCNAAVLLQGTVGKVTIDANYIKRWQWNVFGVQSGTATIVQNLFGAVGAQCVVNGGVVDPTSTQCK